MTGLEKAQAIRLRKNGTRLATLTAYDYPTARLLDEAGVDLLLVGDSLGMVVLGYPDTTHVTMDHMLHHTAAVARAQTKAIVVADLPINSYETPDMASANARRLIEAGADAVKLEGGIRQAAKVRAITQAGIPVCGHLGMLPQRVLEEGGYKKKGRTPEQVTDLIEGANALVEAGVFAIVLESVIPEAAIQLTRALSIPTIGIGSGGATCDGEVAVITDLLGSFPWFVPPFAQPQANLSQSITQAVHAYRSRVQTNGKK